MVEQEILPLQLFTVHEKGKGIRRGGKQEKKSKERKKERKARKGRGKGRRRKKGKRERDMGG